MKKALLLFVVIIALYSPLRAQDFVYYNGDNEKTLLNSAQTPDDFLKLALSSELNDSESEFIYNKFIQDIKQLNLEAVAGDKSEKHLKKIYQLVHDHFLKNYNPHAHFGDFIISGDYNCVNASVLYAYILETLKIPYNITQLPAHVYVVATSGSDKVKFETMDPSQGLYVFDDQSKRKNVNELIKAGYMDQSYVANAGVERAFDDFFYDKQDITLKEAVALVYFNRAFEEMQSDKPAAAYSDISKSNSLFPDKKNDFIENSLLGDMVSGFKYDDLADWRALSRLANSKSSTDELKKYLEGEFNNYLINKLINAGQKEKVAKVYNCLRTNVIDTAVKKVISEEYFFENSQYAYLTNDYDASIANLEIAYKLAPDNPLVVSNFTQMILHKYVGSEPSAQNYNAFDSYISKYPLLKDNPVVTSLYIYFMSFLSINGFAGGNGATGEKYMLLLERELDTHPNHQTVYNQQIAKVFAMASVYYFHKQGKEKAAAVLKDGLKYEPEDPELIRKLNADTH